MFSFNDVKFMFFLLTYLFIISKIWIIVLSAWTIFLPQVGIMSVLAWGGEKSGHGRWGREKGRRGREEKAGGCWEKEKERIIIIILIRFVTGYFYRVILSVQEVLTHFK